MSWRYSSYIGAQRLLYLQYWIFAIKYFESAKNALAGETGWTPKRINFCRWIVAILFTVYTLADELIFLVWTRSLEALQNLNSFTIDRWLWSSEGWTLAYMSLCLSVSLYSLFRMYKTVRELARSGKETMNMSAFFVNTSILLLQVVVYALYTAVLG